MTLSQQLINLKTIQNTNQISPHQHQPTLLLNKNIAATTSQDLIYTSAIIAYSKLVKEKPSLKI